MLKVESEIGPQHENNNTSVKVKMQKRGGVQMRIGHASDQLCYDQRWHFCRQKLLFAIYRFKPVLTGKNWQNSKSIIELPLAMYFNWQHFMAQETTINDHIKLNIDHYLNA